MVVYLRHLLHCIYATLLYPVLKSWGILGNVTTFMVKSWCSSNQKGNLCSFKIRNSLTWLGSCKPFKWKSLLKILKSYFPIEMEFYFLIKYFCFWICNNYFFVMKWDSNYIYETITSFPLMLFVFCLVWLRVLLFSIFSGRTVLNAVLHSLYLHNYSGYYHWLNIPSQVVSQFPLPRLCWRYRFFSSIFPVFCPFSCFTSSYFSVVVGDDKLC